MSQEHSRKGRISCGHFNTFGTPLFSGLAIAALIAACRQQSDTASTNTTSPPVVAFSYAGVPVQLCPNNANDKPVSRVFRVVLPKKIDNILSESVSRNVNYITLTSPTDNNFEPDRRRYQRHRLIGHLEQLCRRRRRWNDRATISHRFNISGRGEYNLSLLGGDKVCVTRDKRRR